MKMKIEGSCECGFKFNRIVWDSNLPSRKLIELGIAIVTIDACHSAGIYSVCIECPNCFEKMEILESYSEYEKYSKG
jgi:hypothetical protein